MKSTRKMLLAGLIGAATILATSSAGAFWGNWGSSPWSWGGNSWGNNWGGGPWGNSWGGGPWGYGGYPGYGGWGGGYPYYGGYGGGYPYYGGYGGGYPYYGGYSGYGYTPYSGAYTYPSTTTTKPAAKKSDKK